MVFDRLRLSVALMLVSLLAASASAAESKGTTLVVHPLVVLGADASEATVVDAVLKLEVARTSWDLVDHEPVRPFLAEQPDGSCADDDACLARLANATKAYAALQVSLSQARPRLLVSAKLVRAGGPVLQTVRAREFKRSGRDLKTSLSEALREVLPDVLSDQESIDVEPLVTKTHPTPPDANVGPVPTKPPAVEENGSPGRTVGLVVGGVGLASLGTSGVVAITALNDAAELEKLLDSEGRWVQEDAKPRDLVKSLHLRSDIVTWTLIGGAALTATGAAIYFLSPADSPASVTIAPGPTPPGASIVGRF